MHHSSPWPTSRPATEPAARYGFMSTLLWDFVQLDVTLVLVWVGIQLGLRPVKRLRDEIARALAAGSAADRRNIGAARDRAGGRHVQSLVRACCARRCNRSSNSSPTPRINCARPSPACRRSSICWSRSRRRCPSRSRLLTLQEGIRQLAHSANQLLTLARADPAANIARQESSGGRSTPSSAKWSPNSSTAPCNPTSIWASRCSRRPSSPTPRCSTIC